MGMFDNVRVLCPLPRDTPAWAGPILRSGEAQTKSFPEPWMTLYTIDEDGRFLVERYDVEPVPPDQREHPFHFLRRVNQREEPCDFHGDLEFYAVSPRREINQKTDSALFWARFTEGRLSRLEYRGAAWPSSE